MLKDFDGYIEHKVIPYRFNDENINEILAEYNKNSCHLVKKYKKQLMMLKVLLVAAAFLLTAVFEYMMFESLWYREPVFQIVMIFTPVLAGTIGYLAALIIDRTFDIRHGLFNSEFQYAYENKYIYVFKGTFQNVHSDEELWTNIIVGDYIWRVRNKVLEWRSFEGKEVLLLLIRNFFDDDVDFECVHIKSICN